MGKYNSAYMRTQDCRPLKTKKHKKRPTGFLGGPFPFANDVRSGNLPTAAVESRNRPTAAEESGYRLPAPEQPGGTTPSEAAASGSTGAAGTNIFPIFRKRPRAPDQSVTCLPWKKR
eukprot:2026227-Amphidinium_carterae.5